MPMHDWKKVDAGIYHAFHHRWISALSDFLNGGSLPSDYYALPEQVAIRPRPKTRFSAETSSEFYRRKKSSVVRHISGDRMVAVLAIHLPPDKPLTLVAYETGTVTRAYIDPVAVGDPLPDMPLYLEPDV